MVNSGLSRKPMAGTLSMTPTRPIPSPVPRTSSSRRVSSFTHAPWLAISPPIITTYMPMKARKANVIAPASDGGGTVLPAVPHAPHADERVRHTDDDEQEDREEQQREVPGGLELRGAGQDRRAHGYRLCDGW